MEIVKAPQVIWSCSQGCEPLLTALTNSSFSLPVAERMRTYVEGLVSQARKQSGHQVVSHAISWLRLTGEAGIGVPPGIQEKRGLGLLSCCHTYLTATSGCVH